VYNFSKDAAGTFFLKQAALQRVSQITLFVNSAVSFADFSRLVCLTSTVTCQPTTFTSNSKSCGGTLVTSRIPAYAQFLTDVVSFWKTQGVVITHVSTMKCVPLYYLFHPFEPSGFSEPDNSFGSGSNCGQEGMIVTPQQRAQVILATAAAFSKAGLSTRVIGDETSSASA
jgi:hypothetical protein